MILIHAALFCIFVFWLSVETKLVSIPVKCKCLVAFYTTQKHDFRLTSTAKDNKKLQVQFSNITTSFLLKGKQVATELFSFIFQACLETWPSTRKVTGYQCLYSATDKMDV